MTAATSGPSEPPDGAALVEELLSHDPLRVTRAAWAIIATRDAAALHAVARALPRIEHATEDLELGGMLMSNRGHLEHAIDRVERFAAGTCLCGAYPDHMRYEPAQEEARGHARIVEEIPVFYRGRPDRPRRICACLDCGQRFEVEEGDYHYVWWKWTPIS